MKTILATIALFALSGCSSLQRFAHWLDTCPKNHVHLPNQCKTMDTYNNPKGTTP